MADMVAEMNAEVDELHGEFEDEDVGGDFGGGNWQEDGEHDGFGGQNGEDPNGEEEGGFGFFEETEAEVAVPKKKPSVKAGTKKKKASAKKAKKALPSLQEATTTAPVFEDGGIVFGEW
jgi:hypothetical protein